jgi:hypothetical protein
MALTQVVSSVVASAQSILVVAVAVVVVWHT